MAAVYLRVLSIVFFVMLVTRFLLNSVTFVSCAVCAADGYIVEVCENSTHTILVQRNSDAVLSVGTLLEALSSFVLLLVISSWDLFNFKRFMCKLYLIEQSYIWTCLVILNLIAAMYTELLHAGAYKTILSVSIVIELSLSTLLALAVSRIDRQIIKRWINDRNENKNWKTFFIVLYDVTLLSYAYRNLGLSLYDTALVARSVSLSNAKSNAKKDWTSFLLVMSVASRGSFAQFFFATFFKDREKCIVCGEVDDNDDAVVENSQHSVATAARNNNAPEENTPQARYKNSRAY